MNDTYPDRQCLQHPYLYHLRKRRKVPLGHFHSPPEYAGEWRCDTHPCSSLDGRWVCIDSPHQGGRRMYLIDVAMLLNSKTQTSQGRFERLKQQQSAPSRAFSFTSDAGG